MLPVRGFEGIKEAFINVEKAKPEYEFLKGVELKMAIVHGLANARKLIEAIKASTVSRHLVEVMACSGGCLGGGEQSLPTNVDVHAKQMEAIYWEDEKMPYRKSHENPEVLMLYEQFLGNLNGEQSHKLLHTYYTERNRV